MSQDEVQNDRLNALEARILKVEQAVQEIAGMAKVVKVIAVALAASLGMDLQGLVWPSGGLWGIWTPIGVDRKPPDAPSKP